MVIKKFQKSFMNVVVEKNINMAAARVAVEKVADEDEPLSITKINKKSKFFIYIYI